MVKRRYPFCISTSGNSENVVCAAEVALAKEINVIALTGATGENSKPGNDLHCSP